MELNPMGLVNNNSMWPVVLHTESVRLWVVRQQVEICFVFFPTKIWPQVIIFAHKFFFFSF